MADGELHEIHGDTREDEREKEWEPADVDNEDIEESVKGRCGGGVLGKAPDPHHPTTTVCKLESVISKDLSPLFSYFLEAIYILWQE